MQEDIPTVKPSDKPQETELKLTLPAPDAQLTVVQKLEQGGWVADKPVAIRNEDIYLDTYDWLLMKNKLSLRYRMQNGKTMYTLKSLGEFTRGIAQRTEIETIVDEPVETPAEIPVKRIREEVGTLIFPRRLVELARVRTNRLEYPLVSPGGAKINLAFDTSTFSREQRPRVRCQKKLYELEAELREGPVDALVSLRKMLTGTFHFVPSRESKLQSAVDFLNLAPLIRKAIKEFTVGLDDSVELALWKIISAEFRWFQEQLPGVVDDIDPEFVHQARVTTRRMRSAIKVFSGAAPESTSNFLADELKWLAALFGDVRDIDVFIINLRRLKEKIDYFPTKTKKALERAIEKERQKPLKALTDALASPRYRKLERLIRQYLNHPPAAVLVAANGVTTIRQFAPQVIGDDFKAVLARGGAVIAKPRMKQFHLLRIQMKKLRYATEFMAPAYGDGLGPFIKSTVEIQDTLGELQDTVFTREFCMRLIEDWRGKLVDSELLFALGEIYQFQAEIARERRETFSGIWERFSCDETAGQLAGVFEISRPQ